MNDIVSFLALAGLSALALVAIGAMACRARSGCRCAS